MKIKDKKKKKNRKEKEIRKYATKRSTKLSLTN